MIADTFPPQPPTGLDAVPGEAAKSGSQTVTIDLSWEPVPDADLAGYTIVLFDLPLLLAEFRRVGLSLPLAGRGIIDVQKLYFLREPRDLDRLPALFERGVRVFQLVAGPAGLLAGSGGPDRSS